MIALGGTTQQNLALIYGTNSVVVTTSSEMSTTRHESSKGGGGMIFDTRTPPRLLCLDVVQQEQLVHDPQLKKSFSGELLCVPKTCPNEGSKG